LTYCLYFCGGILVVIGLINIIKLEKKMTTLLDTKAFKEKIFDFTDGGDWKFAGDKPAIIDFYADWCGPCKTVAPILEQLSNEYEGKVDIYKVDTEAERELSAMFQIRSIPSMLFIPKEGQPQMAVGALPKASIESAMKDVFKIELNK
jgi:thioredoxin